MGIINFFQSKFGKKPNIIMIMIDGARSDVIGSVNYYKQLKKDSIFCSKLITYAPYTIGSLHSLFSGMYGNNNGVNGYYKSYGFDAKNCLTLAQYLKEAGYYTEADVVAKDILPSSGFDKIRVYDEFKEDLTERHKEILNQISQKGPFFLFLDYISLHTNLVHNVIKKYSDFDKEYFDNRKNNLKNYLQEVEKSANYLDSLLKKISEMGLLDNTLVIIFSDHGTSVGDRPGEKAYGVYLYDYTIRCFLYIISKDLPKGLEINELVRSIDILPTMLEILKINEKKSHNKIQGKSFLPLINGKTEERIAYSETGGLGGPTPSPEKHNVFAVRTNKWKLIYNETSKKKELYDLENDEGEINNLAGKKPDIERFLWEEMKNHSEPKK
ncbi:sulfatase-like hydrolase/transferase [Candidatus Woesearchaeota archaeon]|nr:sulfatase-like hydrolase/transferase [Candidatus Woesearchaeota archaeon]